MFPALICLCDTRISAGDPISCTAAAARLIVIVWRYTIVRVPEATVPPLHGAHAYWNPPIVRSVALEVRRVFQQ